MDPISKPGAADNAENAVRCSHCGNTILIGSENGTDQKEVECDICHTTQAIHPDQVRGAPNEDY